MLSIAYHSIYSYGRFDVVGSCTRKGSRPVERGVDKRGSFS